MQQEQIHKPKILTDPLRQIFNEVKETAISEEEAKTVNVTNSVWHSFETRLASNEPINCQIRGDPATGKSTVGSKIGLTISREIGLNQGILDGYNKFIFSDQIEFLRFMNTKMENIAIVIDEWNRMVNTGYNATTEMTLFDYYSDVFAQRFVHRISCAPSNVVDKNCYLFLDIEGRDLEKKVTRLKVIYKDIVTGESLVIGHFDIYVGDTMQMPWYGKYREKKFKRMELLEKNGIRDIRELEFADVALRAFLILSDTAKTVRIKTNTINKTVDMVRRQQGRIYSMLTMNEITGRVKGLLDLLNEKKSLERKFGKMKMGEEKNMVMRAIENIDKIFKLGLQDETRLANIYNSYINMSV